MADEPTRPDVPEEGDDYGVEEEAPMEVETPRRAASAQFVVDGSVGSQAAMREAMDPAHQSLTDALRLSYRVLQVVMVILIVLFAFSGVQTIDEGQSGVMLRWGDIQDRDIGGTLGPGIHISVWPYPAGEFVIVQDTGRAADVGTGFWPGIRPGQNLDEMIDNASATGMLRPGRDGYVLTGDGDIGHMQAAADYKVADVVHFVTRVDDASDQNADRIVRLALERSVVHESAAMALTELVDLDDASRDAIQMKTQAFLDPLECGILIDGVRTPDSRAALAIERSFREAQAARTEAEAQVQQARQQADKMLIDVAGANWPDLLDKITGYEIAHGADDDAGTQQYLDDIGDFLRSDMVGGEVATTVRQAEGYEAQIELTLGADVQVFEGLLEAYRSNPELTVASLWLESYSRVLSNDTAEVIRVHDGDGRFVLRIGGNEAVQELRTERRLAREQHRQMTEGMLGNSFAPTRGDVRLRGPGRLLDVDEEGNVSGLGGGRP